MKGPLLYSYWENVYLCNLVYLHGCFVTPLSPNTLICAQACEHTHTVRSLLNNLTSYVFAFSLQIVPTPAYNAHPLFPNYLKPIRHSMVCCNVVTSMKPSLMALAKPALSPL